MDAQTETVTESPTESLEAYFTRANVAERDGTLALVDNPDTVAEPTEAVAEPVAEAPNAEPVKAAKNPRKDPQARIDEVVGKQREAERAAAEAVARAERAERELAAARQPAKQPQAPPAAPAAASFPDFASWSAQAGNETKQYEDYIRASVRHEIAEEKRIERTQQDERAFVAKIAESSSAFWQRMEDQTKDEPGFLDTLDQHLRQATRSGAYASNPDGTFYDRTTGEKLPPPTFANFLMEQVFKSDQPKALLRYLSDLATQERQRLATLPPDEVIRALAKVEATTGPAAASRGSAPAPRKSVAPDPITPLGSSPVQSGDEPTDDEPVDAYIRRENAKDRKAGRL